jgi:dihydropteroate synthase
MGPSLRISVSDAFSLVLSGLTAAEVALLQKIFVMSDRPDRPAFDAAQPGRVSMHGTPSQLQHCAERLAGHPALPEHIRTAIRGRFDNYRRTEYRLAVGGRDLDLGNRTHIMGVLNVTPDSFSDGGQFADADRALAHGREMAAAGADIIDIGGESTRPGAEPLSQDEELRRIIPVIERLSADCPIPLSVDTYKSSVAVRALKAGASIVNDISGLRFSPDMGRVVADHGAAVVLMHIKGTPRDMQVDPAYDDVVAAILQYLEGSIGIALRAGIRADRILIDPGIGFGKTAEHNLTILDRLDEFRVLGCPIVLGTSRKRFIGSVLGIDEPMGRVMGTAATVALGIARGAKVVRVHDVAEMVQVARMTDAIVRACTKH